MKKLAYGIFVVGVLALGVSGQLLYSNYLSDRNIEYRMFGNSMTPTIPEGKTVDVTRVNPEAVSRGDIIVFKSSSLNDEALIKRVVGLPGDIVSMQDGLLTVTTTDNAKYVPYSRKQRVEVPRTSVKDNHFYVVGDNLEPGESIDSRNQLGQVLFDDLVGVASGY